GPQFIVNISNFLDQGELKPGARVGLNQRTLNVMKILPTEKDPFVRGMEIEESPDVTYKDVGGLKKQIREIKETVGLPLLKKEALEKVGVEPPHGVLLYGPPGTGKTLLARAVAHETEATFIRLIGSELVHKYVGEGARMVREMFDFARERAPSIVFIDEVDAIASSRMKTSTSGDREVHRTMMQLLAELDGFEPRGNVKILAATNRPDILDRALLRPGRFDRLIEFPKPDKEARAAIFEIHTRGMSLGKDVNLEKLAKLASGVTGADIKAICTEAGIRAIRKDRDAVNPEDFKKAIQKVLTETEKPDIPGVMFG
ncbi:nucleotidase, partial [candidate division MSBL1 archaeon SCGC-AAA261O19]